MPGKAKPSDDPTQPQPGQEGDTKTKPPAQGPKKAPPIDPPEPPIKDGKGDDKKDKKDGPDGPKCPPNVVVNVHIHLDGKDDGIKIGKWVQVDDPREKGKAKKRIAWKRTQIHRTTNGK